MRNLLYIITFSVFITSCVSPVKDPKEIDINKMKVVVWQLMKADEYYGRTIALDTTWRTNKKNVLFYNQIFELNKIDRAQFYKQMTNMEANPAHFKELMDSVNELSKREKNVLKPP